jgi:hypothetical protein
LHVTRVLQKLDKKRIEEQYEFFTDGGNWQKGIFSIESDIFKIYNQTVSLSIESINNHEVYDPGR